MKRVTDLICRDILSQKICKKCGKNIPLWQYNHYLLNYKIELSFCRDFLQRIECFPKKMNKSEKYIFIKKEK